MYSLVTTTTPFTNPFRLRVRPWAFDRLDTPVVTSAWEDGALKLTVDLPGVPRDAVDVSVAGRILSLGAKTETLSWQRQLTLGSSLDPEQVAAQYADGRLTVVVGPVAETQPRRIEIETASAPAIETGDQAEGEQDTSSTA